MPVPVITHLMCRLEAGKLGPLIAETLLVSIRDTWPPPDTTLDIEAVPLGALIQATIHGMWSATDELADQPVAHTAVWSTPIPPES